MVNAYCGALFKKKAGYEYTVCVRWTAHDPGGMSSSMAFNRAFAEELFQDLVNNEGKHYWAANVVKRETMPKFRCRVDEGQAASIIYVCHPGADCSVHWLGEE